MMDDAEREKIDDPDVVPTAYIGLLGVIAIVLSILLVHGIYYAVEVGIETKQVLSAELEELEETRTAQRGWIQQFRWTDKAKGLCGIPIEDAMKLMIDERKR